MASRIRPGVKHIFECFLEVVKPTSSEEGAGQDQSPWILQTFPPTYKDKEAERLKTVPSFVFPCSLEVANVQNFSFVLTNLDAQWTFGFCRHAPNSQTALVMLSSLPWHECFYRLLNHAAELTLSTNDGELWRFLDACYNARLPEPGKPFQVSWTTSENSSLTKEFTCQTPMDGVLPSIPENRNLTEYYNAVGIHNMLVIFASMLFERRIIITSRRLSRLSACVQAANTLIYPMHWQHIFIPILPKHFIEYLSAPMPFLIGVPSPIMQRVKSHELGEAVLLDADANVIQSPFADLEALPNEVSGFLKKALKSHKDLLGESVSRAFLQALVMLIGGYRDALKFRPGEKITFSEEAFLQSRPITLRPFLEQMLHLQIFRQFIEERLEMLNTGKGFTDEFEMEAVRYQERLNNSNKFRSQYATISSSMRKEGGALMKAVKSKISPKKRTKKFKPSSANPAMKNAVKSVRESSRGIHYKGKSAYKGFKTKMKTTTSSTHLDEDALGHHPTRLGPSSSAPSSPVQSKKLGISGSSGSSVTSGVSVTGSQIATSTAFANSQPSVSRIGITDQLNDIATNIGSRVLKYERFDPPKLTGVPKNPFHQSSSDSQLSPDIEYPKKLDLDLLNDLQEVFFKKSEDAPPINRHLKPSQRRSLAQNPGESGIDTIASEPDLNHNDPVSQLQPIAPPRAKKSSSKENSNKKFLKSTNESESHSNGRKESVGDLINLGSSQKTSDDVIFDPLLEPKTPDHKRSLPHPPSASTLPKIAQMYRTPSPVNHKPLQRSSNPFNPFSNVTNGSPMNNPTMSQFTKSSDDLLKDYGIDFSKLATSDYSSSYNKNALSMIGQDDGNDPFADLDPLKQKSVNQQPQLTSAVPMAPPRSKKSQNWTTFD